MKRYLVASAMAGLLAVSSLSVAERSFNLATPVVILMPHVLPNAELLELTPMQRQQAMQIANQMNVEREANDLMARDLRRELWEETSRYQVDLEAQTELLELIAQTEKRRVEMSIECSTQLRNILTEEQWELLVELAADVQN